MFLVRTGLRFNKDFGTVPKVGEDEDDGCAVGIYRLEAECMSMKERMRLSLGGLPAGIGIN